jgi:multidrug transporter EmrE-like cation transporter
VGIGAVAILGVVFARDSISSLRIVSLALIVLGVAGVALTSGIGSTSGTR